MDQAIFSQFSGEPRTSVPQVDPEDIKAVWKLGQEVKKDHPDGQVFIGMHLLGHSCWGTLANPVPMSRRLSIAP